MHLSQPPLPNFTHQDGLAIEHRFDVHCVDLRMPIEYCQSVCQRKIDVTGAQLELRNLEAVISLSPLEASIIYLVISDVVISKATESPLDFGT